MAFNEKFTATIEVNGQQAQNEVKRMEGELENLRKKQREALHLRTEAGNKEAMALQKQIDQRTKDLQKEKAHVKGLQLAMQNLSEQGYKELQKQVRALTKTMRSGSVQKNSEEWKALAEKIKACKREMREYEVAVQNQASMWQRFTKFLNDSWGGLAMVASSIAGLSITIRKTVADYAAMQQEMANVRKYTGQTADEVERMNEDFKRMDTRTSREELNRLAGAAGRLGITETAMVEEFVDGADKIRVALGDDLGEGAVDIIGKLAIAFGEDKEKGLRGAMLATGSALNELVQSSPAQAQPIIDFTSKLSGVGQQAHMTQAQIMGFAAALDQNNQEMATSSTVMSQLITKMYQDPARFAKMAGMEVQKFAELVKTDMNSALVEWLQHLNKLGDMSVLAGKFDELKMDGTRAVGVLATLAGHIDQVTEAQRTATKAYEEGNSVIEEFNIQNGTVQAQTEKAKKRFHDLAIELGEKLLPVVKYTVSGTSQLVRGMSATIDFVTRNYKLLLSLTSLIAIYNAARIKTIAVEKAALALKKTGIVLNYALVFSKRLLLSAVVALQASWALLTKGVKAYNVVMRAARIASITNPWTALATVLTGLGIVIYSLTKAWSKHREEMRLQNPAYAAAKKHAKDMADIAESVNNGVAKETATIKELTRIIRSNAYTIGEREAAIKELQKIVPGYHASISAEGRLIETNREALDEYITSLMKAAKAQAYMDKLAEIAKEKLDNDAELKRNQDNLKRVSSELQRGQETGEYKSEKRQIQFGLTSVEVEGNKKLNEKLKERDKQEKAVLNTVRERTKLILREKELSEAMRKDGILAPVTVDGTKKQPGLLIPESASPEEVDEDKMKKMRKERIQEARAQYEAELAEEMLAYRQGITTYSQYMQERHNITQNYYDEQKRIYGEDSAEYRKLLQKRESDEQEYEQFRRKQDEDGLTREKLEREMALRRQFYDETNSQAYQNQEVLDEALFQLEIEYMQRRKKLYNDGSKEWVQIDDDIRQKEMQHQWELEQDWMKRLARYREEMGRTDLQKRQQMEEEGAKAIYGALVGQGRITQEEYDAILEHIRRKYAQLKAETSASQSVQAKAGKSLDTAEKAAGAAAPFAGNDAATGMSSVLVAVERQKLINERLKELYGEDYANNAEYQEAKRQLDSQTMQSIVAGAEAAYSTISTMLSAASSYAQACSDLEVARITRNYDQQIEAAGKSTKKREKLEKEKDEAIAKAKTKANKRAMVMELAQALAQTAMGAISAYSSTMAGAPYPANLILAPISAGIATAAGMLQVATIKKQHQAEAAGYYEGGFTGGRSYRKEAGVVHEGEFVANHQAVNNTQLAPVFSLIDRAQRNNRVAQLKAEDVGRAIGSPAAAVVAPVVNVQTDSSELQSVMSETRETMDRLNEQLQKGIRAKVSIDGEDGVKRNLDRYNQMISKK